MIRLYARCSPYRGMDASTLGRIIFCYRNPSRLRSSTS